MNQMLKHSGELGVQLFSSKFERSEFGFQSKSRGAKTMSSHLGRKLRSVYDVPDAQTEPPQLRALLGRLETVLG
ncbi:hypothetical protein [Methylocapsa palsarum]|uniref:Uncharacterized protein n=1 Tax=Methylocapsa palsarum TaxID=1612308 RepID=A0A1I3X4B6_9HYPH|nr:hypothetical protein [Methylocapsa palsarum]SFK14518.1 hypothetical protein SAMN05444581_102359 [Methylocapsa palsarum]